MGLVVDRRSKRKAAASLGRGVLRSPLPQRRHSKRRCVMSVGLRKCRRVIGANQTAVPSVGQLRRGRPQCLGARVRFPRRSSGRIGAADQSCVRRGYNRQPQCATGRIGQRHIRGIWTCLPGSSETADFTAQPRSSRETECTSTIGPTADLFAADLITVLQGKTPAATNSIRSLRYGNNLQHGYSPPIPANRRTRRGNSPQSGS